MPASDPATLANACIQDLVTAFRPAMEDLGKEMQEEMREIISVPVQYVPHQSARPAKPHPIGNKPGPGLTQGRKLGRSFTGRR